MNCEATAPGRWCPRASTRVHQCALCLNPEHGAEHPHPCHLVTSAASRAEHFGKGRGKGKKGRKWQLLASPTSGVDAGLRITHGDGPQTASSWSEPTDSGTLELSLLCQNVPLATLGSTFLDTSLVSHSGVLCLLGGVLDDVAHVVDLRQSMLEDLLEDEVWLRIEAGNRQNKFSALAAFPPSSSFTSAFRFASGVGVHGRRELRCKMSKVRQMVGCQTVIDDTIKRSIEDKAGAEQQGFGRRQTAEWRGFPVRQGVDKPKIEKNAMYAEDSDSSLKDASQDSRA